MTNFSPKIYRVARLEFFVPRQRFFVIACNRKQPIGEGSWNKEISLFFLSPAGEDLLDALFSSSFISSVYTCNSQVLWRRIC